MTNLELNMAIAELICDEEGIKVMEGCVFFVNTLDLGECHALFDFNNWNDLMPLLIEHTSDIRISAADNGLYQASLEVIGYDDTNYLTTHENPRHALALSLLRVLTNRKENERK